MNTPAHAITNLLVLGRAGRPETVWPIAAGSLVPDAPMFLFYAAEKARGMGEGEIWNERYFDAGWQAFFDLFNSLPLIALGALVAWRLGAHRWLAFCASMALHCLCDLPLHREDAHRHFFPLSDWKFESAVSYWDPAAGGAVITLLEIALVLIGSVVLWRRGQIESHRWFVALIGAAYAAYFGYVALVWM